MDLTELRSAWRKKAVKRIAEAAFVLLSAVVMPYLINIFTRGPVPSLLRWIESYTWLWITGCALLLVAAAYINSDLKISQEPNERSERVGEVDGRRDEPNPLSRYRLKGLQDSSKLSLAGAAVLLGNVLLWIFTAIVEALICLYRSLPKQDDENGTTRTVLNDGEKSEPTISSGPRQASILLWPPQARAGLLFIVTAIILLFMFPGDGREIPGPVEEAAYIDNISPQSRASWKIQPGEDAKFNDDNLVLQPKQGATVYAASTYMEQIENPNAALSIDFGSIEGIGQYGALCHVSDLDASARYYRFAVRDDGYVSIYRRGRDGKEIPLLSPEWMAAPTIQRGDNQISVICANQSNAVLLELRVNGSRVVGTQDYTTTSEAILSGGLSIFVQSDHGHSASIYVDRVQVDMYRVPLS